MISRITRRIYLDGLHALERGDIDTLLARFDRRCTFSFAGDTPLGAQRLTGDDIRRWFERFRRLLPDPRFEIRRFVASGPPWNQRVASHVLIRSTVDGEPYVNEFAQFLRLRWGKVLDDLVLEDTQRWERACHRLAETGVAEAAEEPLGGATHVLGS